MSDPTTPTGGGIHDNRDPATGQFTEKPQKAVDALVGTEPTNTPTDAPQSAVTPVEGSPQGGPTTPPPATPALLARVADSVPDGVPVMSWAASVGSWGVGAAGTAYAALGPVATGWGSLGIIGAGIAVAGVSAASSPKARKGVASAWSGASRRAGATSPGIRRTGVLGKTTSSKGSTVKRSTLPGVGRGGSGRRTGGGTSSRLGSGLKSFGKKAGSARRTTSVLAKDATATRRAQKAAYAAAGPRVARAAKIAQAASKKIEKKASGTPKTGTKGIFSRQSPSSSRSGTRGGKGLLSGTGRGRGPGRTSRPGTGRTPGTGRGPKGGPLKGSSPRGPKRGNVFVTDGGPGSSAPSGTKIKDIYDKARTKIGKENAKVKAERDLLRGDLHERYKKAGRGVLAWRKKLLGRQSRLEKRKARLERAVERLEREPRWLAGRVLRGQRLALTRARLEKTTTALGGVETDLGQTEVAMTNLQRRTYGEVLPGALWHIRKDAPPPTAVPLYPYFEQLDPTQQQQYLTTDLPNEGVSMNNPYDIRPECADLYASIGKAPLGSALYAYYSMGELQDGIQAQMDAWSILAEKAKTQLPMYAQAADAIGAVGLAYRSAWDAAGEVKKMAHAHHRERIARLENAKVEEIKWDRVRNDASAGTSGESGVFSILPGSEAIRDKMARADSEGMMVVIYALEAAPEAIKHQAATFSVMGRRCAEEMPFHRSVADAMTSVKLHYNHAVKAIEEAALVVRRVHADDIAHVTENDLPNKGAWDISSL